MAEMEGDAEGGINEHCLAGALFEKRKIEDKLDRIGLCVAFLLSKLPREELKDFLDHEFEISPMDMCYLGLISHEEATKETERLRRERC